MFVCVRMSVCECVFVIIITHGGLRVTLLTVYGVSRYKVTQSE